MNHILGMSIPRHFEICKACVTIQWFMDGYKGKGKYVSEESLALFDKIFKKRIEFFRKINRLPR